MGNWNFYNEWEPYAADWLRNLIKKGLIPDGEVDTRSIVDVQPNDLRGFTQCHFFAGIAGFSLALKLARFPADREIWTGSCPCQPFSVAGKGKGEADERHLWPHLYRLISACRPPVAIGEQVGGAAGLNWLDGVFDDLESQDYSCQAFNLSACSVNAPHIRERLYWVGQNVGVTNSAGWYERQSTAKGMGYGDTSITGSGNSTFNLDNAQSEGLEGRIVNTSQSNVEAGNSNAWTASSNSFDMADTKLQREGRRGIQRSTEGLEQMGSGQTEESIGSSATDCNDMAQPISIRWDINSGQTRGGESQITWGGQTNYWHEAIWLNGADGKTRRAPGISQPNVCCLDDGFWYRVDDVFTQIAREALKEVEIYASKAGRDPKQILPLVWNYIYEEEICANQEPSLGENGGQIRLQQTEILLNKMWDILSTQKQSTAINCDFKEEGTDNEEAYLRGLRSAVSDICSSLRRKPYEQFAGKSSDPLLALSQFLAQCGEKAWEISMRQDASALLIINMKNRASALKALGNAIVPQLAAEVIKSIM
jgi:site-specific DNA-cytosine methylase